MKKFIIAMAIASVHSVSYGAFENADSTSVKVYNLRGNTIVEKVQTSYDIVMSEETWELAYILKGKTSKKINLAAEGTEENSEISLFKIDKNGSKIVGNPLWTKKVKGGSIGQKWNFVTSTVTGCCDSPNRVTMYTLEKGDSVLTYLNDQIYHISIPNQKVLADRFVAVTDEDKVSEKDKDLVNVATLTYMSKDNTLLDRIFLFVKLPSGWGTDLSDFKAVEFVSNGKIQIRNDEIDLFGSSGKTTVDAFTGVAFQGSFYYDSKEVKFIIPIEGNKFKLEKAQISSDLVIERN